MFHLKPAHVEDEIKKAGRFSKKAQPNSTKCLICMQEERNLTLMGTLDILPQVVVIFSHMTVYSCFQIAVTS
jgi:hypothetical protein